MNLKDKIEQLAPEAIFWDFDGVIMASNEVRDSGFEKVLADYPKDQVDKLLAFHRKNGGLSRYVKFRHFFEEIRGESISDTEVKEWAEKFSEIMRKLLTDPGLQIKETISYIKRNHKLMPMYIVSGSDQEELRFLCMAHGIADCFKRIHGSPTAKKEWVKIILEEENLIPGNCVLIGDSVNDWEAAKVNEVNFMAYNCSDDLINKSSTYIEF